MTAALTPALTLDYVHALSADVRAAVVLDRGGALLAGPESLATPSRELLAIAPAATLLEGVVSEGAVYAARDDQHAVVAVTGPLALQRLTRHDLRTALAALGGGAAVGEVPTVLPVSAVRALLHAVEDGFRRPSAISRSEYGR